jgi:hypothetical protein
MVERPETVRQRVRDWLREATASDPVRFGDVDEESIIDEVDETVSSEQNIEILAQRFGLPTPDELAILRGGRRGEQLAEIQEEELLEKQARSIEQDLVRAIKEAPPGEQGEAIRQLIEFSVQKARRDLERAGASEARIAQLEKRVKEAERTGERVRRGVTERLAEFRGIISPPPPLPSRPTAAELLRQFADREKAIEERIDALVARGGAGGLQKNEASDLRRRVRAEREMLVRSFNSDQLTAEEFALRVAALLDAEDEEIAQVIAGRAEVEKPTVEIVRPGRRPPPRAVAPGPYGPIFPGPAPSEGTLEERLDRIESLLRRERRAAEAPSLREMGISIVRDLEKIRREAPDFVRQRLAEGRTAVEIIREYRRSGGFFPTV